MSESSSRRFHIRFRVVGAVLLALLGFRFLSAALDRGPDYAALQGIPLAERLGEGRTTTYRFVFFDPKGERERALKEELFALGYQSENSGLQLDHYRVQMFSGEIRRDVVGWPPDGWPGWEVGCHG